MYDQVFVKRTPGKELSFYPVILESRLNFLLKGLGIELTRIAKSPLPPLYQRGEFLPSPALSAVEGKKGGFGVSSAER
ncbi:MAG: hypothetical protein AABY87_13330 [bacterium]